MARAGGVQIVHPWVRATSGPQTDLYFELTNASGGPVTVTGAAGLGRAATVMGASIRAEGAAVPLGAYEIPNRTIFAFEPDGVFVRLAGLDRALARGDTVNVQLMIEPVGAINIVVEVEASDATAHSHAGHAH